jgi:uncharacterized YigZ family protein
MEKEQYITVNKNTEKEIEKIKGSRFIGRLYGIKDREEAESDLEKIRKMFHDATHNCFAYTAGFGENVYIRSSDDGEPSGTAGRPMQTVLESSGLSNVLLVVTRYYGGTNLGPGGLIKAYTEAAKEVIETAQKVTVEIRENVKFSYIYDQTSMVMNLINKYEASIISESYTDKPEATISINKGFAADFISEIFDRSSGRIRAELCL